jgi:hypothetical protein
MHMCKQFEHMCTHYRTFAGLPAFRCEEHDCVSFGTWQSSKMTLEYIPNVGIGDIVLVQIFELVSRLSKEQELWQWLHVRRIQNIRLSRWTSPISGEVSSLLDFSDGYPYPR